MQGNWALRFMQPRLQVTFYRSDSGYYHFKDGSAQWLAHRAVQQFMATPSTRWNSRTVSTRNLTQSAWDHLIHSTTFETPLSSTYRTLSSRDGYEARELKTSSGTSIRVRFKRSTTRLRTR